MAGDVWINNFIVSLIWLLLVVTLLQILVPHVMWSAQVVRELKIDHTQHHLSTPKHIIVQWVGIGTHIHTHTHTIFICFVYKTFTNFLNNFVMQYIINICLFFNRWKYMDFWLWGRFPGSATEIISSAKPYHQNLHYTFTWRPCKETSFLLTIFTHNHMKIKIGAFSKLNMSKKCFV